MVCGVTENAATTSSFSERVKNTFEKNFPLTMGTVTGHEIDIKEDDEDNEENDDSESQVSLSSSTHKN